MTQKKTKINILLNVVSIFLTGCLIFIGAYFFTFPTGYVSLQIQETYLPGELITGHIDVTLNQGELLPTNTELVVENGGEAYEYELSNLINLEENVGEFYVKNLEISGSGEGYGISGSKETSSAIEFDLKISKEKKGESEPEESPTISITGEVTGKVTLSYNPEQRGWVMRFLDKIGLTRFITPIMTGQAVKTKKISGSVTVEQPFIYELEEDEEAMIIPGSVRIDSKKVDTDLITLTQDGTTVTVTTEHSREEEGFGEDYLGDENLLVEIELSQLNIIAKEGELKVSLNYNNLEIVSASAVIEVEEEVPEEPINETEEVPEINETIEEINETTEEVPVEENLPAPTSSGGGGDGGSSSEEANTESAEIPLLESDESITQTNVEPKETIEPQTETISEVNKRKSSLLSILGAVTGLDRLRRYQVGFMGVGILVLLFFVISIKRKLSKRSRRSSKKLKKKPIKTKLTIK